MKLQFRHQPFQGTLRFMFARQKLHALKEANETGSWLELLFKTGFIYEESYQRLNSVYEHLSFINCFCKDNKR